MGADEAREIAGCEDDEAREECTSYCSDDDGLDLARARVDWSGRFADRAADASYVEFNLKPVLAARLCAAAAMYCAEVVLIVCTGVGWVRYSADGDGAALPLAPVDAPPLLAALLPMLVASALFALYAGAAARQHGWSCERLSTAGTVLLMAMFAHHLCLKTPRWLDARAARGPDGAVEPLPSGSRLIQLLVIPACVAVLIELEPLQHVCFSSFCIVLACVCHAVAPTAGLIAPAPLARGPVRAAGGDAVGVDWNNSSDLALWVALMVLLCYCAVRRSIARRVYAHFYVATRRNIRQMRLLSDADMARALEIGALEAAKVERAKLLRMVMHDLRSPCLSIINISSGLVEQSAPADGAPPPTLQDPTVLESLQGLETCATLMERIVSDMLDFERISGGRLVLLRQPFSLAHLVDAVHVTFAGLAAAKGVALVVEALPADCASFALVGDERRLQQCLNNGLSNAIKFTEPGGTVVVRAQWLDDDAESAREMDGHPEAEVVVHSARADAEGEWCRLRLTVADDGVGMTSEELEQIQSGEAFVQVGRGQMQGNCGTGIGLTIVRQILALHDGSTLKIESDGHGRGTRFHVDLRARRIAVPAASDEAARSEPSAAVSAPAIDALGSLGLAAHKVAAVPLSELRTPVAFRAGFRLLYVEDDNVLRRSLQLRLLNKLGCHVVLASNGKEAVQAVREISATATPLLRALREAEFLAFGLGAKPRSRRALGEGDSGIREGEESARELALRLASELPSIDLIIMDNQMPEMTGEKATRALRALGYSGVIVGCTGDPLGSPDRAEYEASGLDACVDKDSAAIERIHGIIRSFALGGPNSALAPAVLPSAEPALPECASNVTPLDQSCERTPTLTPLSGRRVRSSIKVAPLPPEQRGLARGDDCGAGPASAQQLEPRGSRLSTSAAARAGDPHRWDVRAASGANPNPRRASRPPLDNSRDHSVPGRRARASTSEGVSSAGRAAMAFITDSETRRRGAQSGVWNEWTRQVAQQRPTFEPPRLRRAKQAPTGDDDDNVV